LRVLIIEDYPDTAAIIAELLTELGHDCRIATTGQEALSVAEAFEAELALVDIGLPDVSGYDLLRDLHTRYSHQPPYFVALTGWQEAFRHAMEAGFDDCLLKPASRAQLVRVIALAEAHLRYN
jgi:CheY-like chemotaxis protein